MSFILDILKEFYDTELNYKGIRVNIFGIPRFLTHGRNSLQVNLNRLKNKGYIDKKGSNWEITSGGKKYFEKKYNSLRQFDSPFKDKSSKNLMIIFDIPEKDKPKREWLRWQLKKFNFEMIQRSVWVGPSPLPKEFISYLKEIEAQEYIKTYKLSKPYK